MGHSYKALDLLLENDFEKATKLAGEIKEFNNERQYKKNTYSRMQIGKLKKNTLKMKIA